MDQSRDPLDRLLERSKRDGFDVVWERSLVGENRGWWLARRVDAQRYESMLGCGETPTRLLRRLDRP